MITLISTIFFLLMVVLLFLVLFGATARAFIELISSIPDGTPRRPNLGILRQRSTYTMGALAVGMGFMASLTTQGLSGSALVKMLMLAVMIQLLSIVADLMRSSIKNAPPVGD